MAIGNNGGSSSRGQSYGGHRAELHEVGCSPTAPSSLFLSLSAGRQTADVCRPQSPPSDMHLFEYTHVHRLAQFFSGSDHPRFFFLRPASPTLSLSTYTHARARTQTHTIRHTRACKCHLCWCLRITMVLIHRSTHGLKYGVLSDFIL